jgi:hypothetical protein
VTWLGSLPAWAIFPLFAVAALLLTVALDGILRRHLLPIEARNRAGPTAATTLQALATIYAVLVAFVIVDEYNQFRSAQSYVSNQAAQLSVVTENSRNLPNAEGAPIRAAAIAYANEVVRVGLPEIERHAQPSIVTDRAFERVFAVVNAIEPTAESDKAAYSQILVALGNIAENRTNIVNSAHASIPSPLIVILAVLVIATLAVATLMDTRHRRAHLFILAMLAIALSMTLALVAALDYPYRGFIRIDGSPITSFVHDRAEQ